MKIVCKPDIYWAKLQSTEEKVEEIISLVPYTLKSWQMGRVYPLGPYPETELFIDRVYPFLTAADSAVRDLLVRAIEQDKATDNGAIHMLSDDHSQVDVLADTIMQRPGNAAHPHCHLTKCILLNSTIKQSPASGNDPALLFNAVARKINEKYHLHPPGICALFLFFLFLFFL